jgi:hypothetical protein
MTKNYSIEVNQDSKIREYSFDVQQQNMECSTYSEILKIFREAFSLIDINKIIRKA